MIEKICKECGKKMFFTFPSRAKKNKGFCSHKCMGEANRIKIWKKCPECKKYYLATNQEDRRKKFCSPECAYKNRKKRPRTRIQLFETSCGFCGKILLRWRFQLKRSKNSFCNMRCQMAFHKKINLVNPINKSHNNTQFKKGQIPWNKGTKGLMPVPWNKDKTFKHTDEAKKKISEASFEMWKRDDIKERIPRKLEKHHNWKGGGMIKTCDLCKKRFKTEYYRRNERRFCSMDCWIKYRFGTKEGQYEFFKSRLFKNVQLIDLDKKAIRTRVRLFKLKREEVIQHDEIQRHK